MTDRPGRPWIRVVDETTATGEVARVYAAWRARQGLVPNIVKAVSLRPALLAANDAFRQAIIWGASGLGRRREEMIATLAASLLGCAY